PRPRSLNPDIPRELERIMLRCMQKAPRDRWRGAQDIVLALERFLARRVDMNYHARLVQFLKSTGMVTPEEAADYLKEVSPQATDTVTRQLVGRAAAVNGGIAAAVALTTALVALAPVGVPPVEAQRATGAAGAALAPPARPHGRVRVVAHPWAEIWIDGRLVDTTPVAAPIDLDAGAHALVLKNPYFAELKRELTVAPGDAGEAQIFTLAGRKVAPRQATLEAPRPVGELARTPVLLHTVRRGDTLELLAAEYYGRRDYYV